MVVPPGALPQHAVRAIAAAAGGGTRRKRRRAAASALNLPNYINAPTAQVIYYKLFLDNNAYEYGRLFSE